MLTILIKSVIYGLISALIIYGFIYVFHTILIAPFKARKYIKSGNYKTVTAHLPPGGISPYDNGDGGYNAVYEYEVDGKKYSKVIILDMVSRYEYSIELYYLNNPKRADRNLNSLGRLENHKRNIFRIWLITGGIVFFSLLITR